MKNKTPLVVAEIKEVKAVAIKNKGNLSLNNSNPLDFENRIKTINAISQVMKKQLKNGIDYGIIPGTKKPSLYKAGALNIALIYGLTQKFQLKKTIGDDFVEYDFKCELFYKDKFVAEGYGCCSSREKKYQKANPWDIRNTILKMAEKRALVDSVLKVGALSEIFTQDLEDGAVPSSTDFLTKDDKLELYSVAYSHFDSIIQEHKKKQDGKNAVKKHLTDKIFPLLGITKSNFMAFDGASAKIFRDYINDGVVPSKEEAKDGKK